ncbi:MAG TPA: DEAD/DEAH box helicase family protein [Ignavibacteriales bacterium]|nr:DEAD/DEAH box helicase family protein [Ignavibacteriales bacterium]
MKRPITDIIWERTPRAWQMKSRERCLGKFESGSRDYLNVATPGAGKSDYGLWVAHDFLQAGWAEQIIIVVPTEHLKKQMAKDAVKFGLDLDPYFKNSQGYVASDYHGYVTTYQAVGQDFTPHMNNVSNKKTIVIFDEIHHAGENLAWGDSVKKAFDGAIFRLAMSGTPFRSDDCMIPFVTYENKISRSDFEYTMAESIIDNVCRPVYFKAFDGEFEWLIEEDKFKHTFKDIIEKDLASKRLRTALLADGNWLKAVIQDADEKLCEIRSKDHRYAGGLIVTMDQKHAKQIAGIVHQLTGERPEVVISEDAGSSGKIEDFANGRDKWIICVKMISEGVNIPRLRVGIYATIVKKELFFRQFTGRFVRHQMELMEQDAFIYIPGDRDIVKIAREIEQEREHALEEVDKKEKEQGENYNLFGEYEPARKGSFVPIGSEATTAILVKSNVRIPNQAELKNKPSIERESVFQVKEKLKAQINRMAKVLAIRDANATHFSQRPDFQKYHKMWIEKGGKNLEKETVEEMEQRLKWLKTMQGNNIAYGRI